MLTMHQLEKRYPTGDLALKGVSLYVGTGEVLGLIGPSGAGKSTLIRCVNQLVQPTSGTIELDGLNLNQLKGTGLRRCRRQIGMIFQEYALVERLTVMENLLSGRLGYTSFWASWFRRFKTDDIERAYSLLDRVGLGGMENKRADALSGGQRQRVGIARALASRPDLIICDEPVSALDVSVQAAVINLLLEIQQAFGSAMIFIAHDLSVVRFFSDDIAVMYLGQIVEAGAAESIYTPPSHPYTEALLSAVPVPDPDAEPNAIRLSGNVPSALDPPSGCRFHTRCPRREMLPGNGRVCEQEVPPWRENGRGHRILCHIPLDELTELQRGGHETDAVMI